MASMLDLWFSVMLVYHRCEYKAHCVGRSRTAFMAPTCGVEIKQEQLDDMTRTEGVEPVPDRGSKGTSREPEWSRRARTAPRRHDRRESLHGYLFVFCQIKLSKWDCAVLTEPKHVGGCGLSWRARSPRRAGFGSDTEAQVIGFRHGQHHARTWGSGRRQGWGSTHWPGMPGESTGDWAIIGVVPGPHHVSGTWTIPLTMQLAP